MGLMAGRAIARAHRVMNYILGKFFLLLLMTGITEISSLVVQKA
jgi:hypothetical protein